MENTQLYDFELTDEEMEQIEALEKNEKLILENG
jgi:diketogulonate reductase-like aldo/keto reductase